MALGAIIWKNFLIRRNHWLRSTLEIVVPLLMLLVVNLWLPADVHDQQSDALISLSHDYQDKCFPSNVEQKFRDKIFYFPKNSFTDDIMTSVIEKCSYKKSHVKGGLFLPSENSTYKYIIEFFNTENSVLNNLKYKIYPTRSEWAYVSILWYYESIVTVRKDMVEDLLELQHAIDESFIALKDSKLSSLPCITYNNLDNLNTSVFIYGVLVVLSIFFAYSFMAPVLITRIIEEKQSGAKELMLMMGLKSSQLWLAKFIEALAVTTFIVSGMVFLLYVPLSASSSVMSYVSPFTFWFVLMCGMVAVICFQFFLSCCFNSTSFAAIFTVIIGFISAVLVGFLQSFEIARWKRLLYCLLPHMGLVYSSQILLEYEKYHKLVQWFERMSPSPTVLTLSDVFIMLIFDIFLYSCLTWYLDKVRPGKFGVCLPYNFFLQKCYWTSNKVDPKCQSTSVPAQKGIHILNLRKEYHSGGGGPSVLAVDDLNLQVKEGGITTLLGHNGAGKSTTMSIVTGLISATSGSVIINGYDIRESPKMARQSLGLCPQQDLLFPDMTSIQILTFFGMIKGLSRKQAVKEAKDLLIALRMEKGEHTYSQNLSGGMKRKVSLGIALIGGSSVLVLDEPTSGVDPELRREICDILLSCRNQRTIFLTTHIMEEADAVSDQIAIMAHGRLKCFGTPMDLKKRFGTGYSLCVVLSKEDCLNEMLKSIQRQIPTAKYKSRNASILSFHLPETETSKYFGLFNMLDEAKDKGKINSYSVAVSTLEDVFLRVGNFVKEEEVQRDVDVVDGSPYKILSSRTELNDARVFGWKLYLLQLMAFANKKQIQLRRSFRKLAFFAAVPIFLTVLSMLATPLSAKYVTSTPTRKVVEYSSSPYANSKIFHSLSSNCLQNDSCSVSRELSEALSVVGSKQGFLLYYTDDLTKDLKKEYNKDFHNYLRHITLAFIFDSNRIDVLHSKDAVHIKSIAANLLHNTFLKTNFVNASIWTAVDGSLAEPPSKDKLLYEYVQPRHIIATNKLKQIPEISGLFSLYFMYSILEETRFGAKALQLLAANSFLYWFSHLIVDFTVYLVFMSVIVTLFILEHGSDIVFNHIGYLIVTIIFWIIGLILVSYVLSVIARSKASAICAGLTIYFLFTYFIPDGIDFLPCWFSYLHPSAIWKYGLSKNDMCHPWLLVVYSCVVFVILLILDSKILGRLFHQIANSLKSINYRKIKGDSDVLKEEELVDQLLTRRSSNQLENAMLVDELKRWYFCSGNPIRRVPAVRGVSFCLKPGECFGLLGVNGAGKSTTFNMLTGQITCSHGNATIEDAKLASLCHRSKFLSYIACCPQSGGIIPTLTGRELLTFFAQLRGFSENNLDESVYKWLTLLELQEYADRECGRYSGGMERKLSAAIAFIWGADVVLLDEPTSGVDPVARRHIWKGVIDTQRSGRAIVLTSHSIEECEALCSRVAIMVEGGFRVIGEPVTLKDKFGGGYSVQIKLTMGHMDDVTAMKDAIKTAFPRGCILTDTNCNIMHYHISGKETPWKDLFQRLELIKKQFPDSFESYMASEISLEEIFLHFAGRRGPMCVSEMV